MSILLPTPLPVASVRRPFSQTLIVSLVVMVGFLAALKLLQVQSGLTPSYMMLLIPVAFSAWYGDRARRRPSPWPVCWRWTSGWSLRESCFRTRRRCG